jgi:hypothetical protein
MLYFDHPCRYEFFFLSFPHYTRQYINQGFKPLNKQNIVYEVDSPPIKCVHGCLLRPMGPLRINVC